MTTASSSEEHDLSFELSFFEGVSKRLPKDYRAASVLAHIYTKLGQIDQGLRMDRKLVRLRPEDASAHYNLACSLALKGRKVDALEALRKAVDLGYDDYDWMLQDEDLQSLQGWARFHAFLQELGVEG